MSAVLVRKEKSLQCPQHCHLFGILRDFPQRKQAKSLAKHGKWKNLCHFEAEYETSHCCLFFSYWIRYGTNHCQIYQWRQTIYILWVKKISFEGFEENPYFVVICCWFRTDFTQPTLLSKKVIKAINNFICKMAKGHYCHIF